MRIFCPKPVEDWVCDVKIDEFCKNTSHDIVYNSKDADVIFLYAKWIWNMIPIHTLKEKHVVMTVHHIVPDKLDPREFDTFNKFVNVYHVPNIKTAETLGSLTNKDIRILPYWLNQARWYKTEVPSSMLECVPDNKITLASLQRDTEGSSIGPEKIPQPKLEKGPDIFSNIVKLFSIDDVSVFIPGWRRNYLHNQLKNYKIVAGSKFPIEDVNFLYNTVRIKQGYYLVTSRYEGGPQAILEAAATETKILSTDVGVAPDILHPDCICSSPEEFKSKIVAGIDHTIEYNKKSVQKLRINNIIPLYDDMLGAL